MKDLPPRDWRGRFGVLTCVNGHDRCYEGPREGCPYCIVKASDRLKEKT